MFFSIPITSLWTLSCFGAVFLQKLGVLCNQFCVCYSKCECIIDLHYCLYFTHYSLSYSLCSLTPCLTNKLELCSTSKWSLSHPQWNSAVFPKPPRVIESLVSQRSTSIFSLLQCATLWAELNFVWHCVTHSSSWIRCSEFSHNPFRMWLILYPCWCVHSHLFHISTEYPEQPRR